MKKTIVSGVLAAVLIIGGGTGLYMTSVSAKGNVENPETFMQHNGMSMEQMNEMMKSGNVEDMQKFMERGNVNFGQMKPFMKQIHPDLNNQQLEELYKEMHGTGGSSNSNNFKRMMGN